MYPGFSFRSAETRRDYSERAPPKCSEVISLGTSSENPFSEILPRFPPIRNVANLASPIKSLTLIRSVSGLSSDLFSNSRPIFSSARTSEAPSPRFKKLKYQHGFEGFPFDERHPRLGHHQLGASSPSSNTRFSATSLPKHALYETHSPHPPPRGRIRGANVKHTK